jgi:hypothetical protein
LSKVGCEAVLVATDDAGDAAGAAGVGWFLFGCGTCGDGEVVGGVGDGGLPGAGVGAGEGVGEDDDGETGGCPRRGRSGAGVGAATVSSSSGVAAGCGVDDHGVMVRWNGKTSSTN